MEVPIEVFTGRFSDVIWCTIVAEAFVKINVSELDDILKFVWKFVVFRFKIAGGSIPVLFGVLKTADKKGMMVKSDEFTLILCAWMLNIFSPSFK